MTNTNNGLYVGAIVAALALVLGILGGTAINGNDKLALSEQDIAGIAAQVKVSAPEVEVRNIDISNLTAKVDAIDAKLSELDEVKSISSEDKALELALSELDSKDFKKAIMAKLNSNDIENQSVEEYKDIKSILVSETDVDVSGDDATVEFEVKVYFFNDGDSEDEDKVKAKFSVSYDVSDLDEDEDFEDAEADLDELTLIKVNY